MPPYKSNNRNQRRRNLLNTMCPRAQSQHTKQVITHSVSFGPGSSEHTSAADNVSAGNVSYGITLYTRRNRRAEDFRARVFDVFNAGNVLKQLAELECMRWRQQQQFRDTKVHKYSARYESD